MNEQQGHTVYSARKSTQYSVVTYRGEESEKDWIYVCVSLIHFAVHLKLTHYKSTIHYTPIKFKYIYIYIYIYIKNLKNPNHLPETKKMSWTPLSVTVRN